MAFSDFNDFKNRLASAQSYFFTKNTRNNINDGLMSYWAIAPNAGSAPTTAAALDNTTTGAIVYPALTNASNSIYLCQCEIMCDHPSGVGFMLYDRLSHQGGLSGTTTGAQTTNLPTAALTRYAGGDGVIAAIEIYADVGITARTLTASYTNQGGTAGRTTKAITFGGNGFNQDGHVMPLPLQDGDTGVRSVESVTISATTGTAGNFGITLLKPLAILTAVSSATQAQMPAYYNMLIGGGGGIIEVLDTACLGLLAIGATGASGATSGYISLVETS